MKRIITLGMALIMMFVSLSGCFIFVEDHDRGERHEHEKGEKHERDGDHEEHH